MSCVQASFLPIKMFQRFSKGDKRHTQKWLDIFFPGDVYIYESDDEDNNAIITAHETSERTTRKKSAQKYIKYGTILDLCVHIFFWSRQ